MFFGFEETFYREAKIAELSLASIRVSYARFKAQLKGGAWAKRRLLVMVVPLLSFLLPAASFQFALPFAPQDFSAGLLGFAPMFTGGVNPIGFISGMTAASVYGDIFSKYRLVMFVTLGAALLGVLVVLLTLFSWFKFKIGTGLVCGVSLLGAVAGIADTAFALLLVSAARDLGGQSLASASFLGGSVLSAAAFAVTFFCNYKFLKQGVTLNCAEGDEERAAIYKKVKAGEVNVDDLPQPVVETAKTRELEETIEREYQASLSIQLEHAEKTAGEGNPQDDGGARS
jgi:hypothetical protein